MNEPEPVENLMQKVDLKAAKIDPKTQYLLVVSCPNGEFDAMDLDRCVQHIKKLVPNAAVLMFDGDIEVKLYDISSKHATTLPVKQIPAIQDREAPRRI